MDREIVERVAKVARMNLTAEELDEFKDDLEDILEYFDILDTAPVKDTEMKITGVMREDIPRSDIDPKDLMRDMKTYEGYVRGPKLS